MQVVDIVHTVTVDTCAGTQIILNRASLGADIVSAKSSELNIVVPGENEVSWPPLGLPDRARDHLTALEIT